MSNQKVTRTSLLGSGTRPIVGDASHALVIAAPTSVAAFLVAGSNRCTLPGGVPLPYDLGKVVPSLAGTFALTSMDLATATVPLIAGQATIPLPIPNITSLLGMSTYWQAFGLTPSSNLVGSAGLAVAIGH